MSLLKRTYSVLEITLILIGVIILVGVIALFPQIFSSHELLFQIIAVVLSVVFTAIVTTSLLNGQTEADLKLQKQSKVFERKLEIYQQFLDKVRTVIEDGNITREEANDLQFSLSNIAIHTDSKDILAVIENVKTIIEHADFQYKSEQSKGDEIPKALVEIVSILRKDLYKDVIDEKDKEAIKGAFTELVKGFDDQVENEVEETSESVSADTLLVNAEMLRKEILSKLSPQWRCEIVNTAPDSRDPISFVFDKGDRNALSFYLYGEGAYYWQIHIDVPEIHRRAVYSPFQTRFGGRQNKFSWWCYLSEKYRGKQAFVSALATDEPTFKAYIVEQAVQLVSYLESFLSLYNTACAPLAGKDGRYNGWMVTPAFSYQSIAFDKEDEGKTYFDVTLKSDGTYSLVLHNRNGNEEQLKALVLRMGITEEEYQKGRDFIDRQFKFIYEDGIPEQQVHAEIDSLIDRLKAAGV